MLDWLVPSAFAMAPPQGGGGAGGNSLTAMLPLVLMFVIFYFLLIRPQQKRAKEHKAMLGALQRGDEVVTSGGLHGKITGVTDDVLTVEIAKDVRVRVEKSAVARRAAGKAG